MEKEEYRFPFVTFSLDDVDFGKTKYGKLPSADECIMTATLQYIISTIKLPPPGAQLTWDEDGFYTWPVVSIASENYKIGSELDREIKAYLKKSSKLNRAQLEGEIYYALEEQFTKTNTNANITASIGADLERTTPF
tara:strand:- start:6174 stop:6584 length:411 start_codon:yes stop_codon:yes gene_type:complete